LDTFELLSTFSYELNPVLLWSKWNFGQSVRTRNFLEAVRALDWPVAFTLW